MCDNWPRSTLFNTNFYKPELTIGIFLNLFSSDFLDRRIRIWGENFQKVVFEMCLMGFWFAESKLK